MRDALMLAIDIVCTVIVFAAFGVIVLGVIFDVDCGQSRLRSHLTVLAVGALVVVLFLLAIWP